MPREFAPQLPRISTCLRCSDPRLDGAYSICVQALLTARWPLEMQHHRHSCIQQIQNVYHSNRGLPTQTSQEANVWTMQSKWADRAEEVFPDLSQVKAVTHSPLRARFYLCSANQIADVANLRYLLSLPTPCFLENPEPNVELAPAWIGLAQSQSDLCCFCTAGTCWYSTGA